MKEDLIYDVGMHNGNDTAFYLALGFRVVAIEADPDLAAGAKERFQVEIKAGRLEILNVAIADREGVAVFWINDELSQLNSFDRELTSRFGHPVHGIEVQCRRLDAILSEHGIPYYLKIDIEGNDLVCCDQLTPMGKPKYISVEMSRIELLLRLRDLGYDRFKLITQFDLQPLPPGDTKCRLQVPRLLYRLANYRKKNRVWYLRAARRVSAMVLRIATFFGLWRPPEPFTSTLLPRWNFIKGECSGSFGKDLPGPWMSWQEVSHVWHRDLREYEKMEKELWCDLHATVSTDL